MIKILTLFSGMGAFEKALFNLRIKYKLVGYCEIDKFASRAYSLIHNVSENFNLGDICKVNETILPDFDLMTWAFPCQDISVAGKQTGIIKGSRSGLYYEGFRILNAKKPKYSIIENVKNLTSKKFKVQFEQILSDIENAGYKNYWKVLNARDYGIPQNRERVFIISIRNDVDKTFVFSEPFDNGIRLKDLLENEVDDKYFISNEKSKKLINQLDLENSEKQGIDLTINKPKFKDYANCIKARYDAGISNQKSDGTGVAIPCLTPDRLEKRQNGRRFKNNDDPMFTITSCDRHGVLIRVGNIGADSQGNRVYSSDGIAVTQCGHGGGLGSKTGLYLTDYRIRRLTPTECWRLMGFKDIDINKCIASGISNTQLYKMAGNSIVVDVLEEIFKRLF
jgi:DNA (cytosine-5)-methyltransferase 1